MIPDINKRQTGLQTSRVRELISEDGYTRAWLKRKHIEKCERL
jgi:hypothetical protein